MVCALLGACVACGGDAASRVETPARPARAAPASPVPAASSAAPPATGAIAFDLPRAQDFGGSRPDAPPPPSPDLPSARTHDDVVVVAAVMLAADGSLALQGRPVDARAFASEARALAKTNPDARVIIHADRQVTYGRVIEVMDVLRQAGITRIAFAVSAGSP